MIVVSKRNGKIHICVDLKHLNESILWEVYPLPSMDETLVRAMVFSKLDTNSGFWQIHLDKPSCLLITFITPLGHYHFNNKLPFGILSAPEHFQKRILLAIFEWLTWSCLSNGRCYSFGED